jgi:hypothetical protein
MKRIITLVLLLTSFSSFAQFVPNGFTPVSTASQNQSAPSMTPDGTGGYVMVWQDLRNSPNNFANYDIYIQRFDASGNMLWANNGVAVCTAVEDQLGPQVVMAKTSNDQPRIMVIWNDGRTKVGNSTQNKIYCQAYDLSGNSQYATDGVEIADCNGFETVRPIAISTLNSSRAVFAYNRRGNPGSLDNYFVQAINADNGTALFTGNGTFIVSGLDDSFGYPFDLSAVPNSQDIYVGCELYNFGNPPAALVVQRINPTNGSKVWASNLNVQIGHRIYTLGFDLDGDVITWSDDRNYQQSQGSNYDVFAQKINPDGTAAWTTNGQTVAVKPSDQRYPSVTRNSFGESFITWSDFKQPSSGLYETWVQKLDNQGNKLFGVDGLLLNVQLTNGNPTIVGQADGGAIVLKTTSNGKNFYVRRLSRDGRFLWGANEREVGPLPSGFILNGGSVRPFMLPNGGAVIGFIGNNDIYAAKFNFCETPPAAPSVPTQYVELNATATLTATGCSGVVNWYDTDHQQGVIVGTGPTFSFTATATATYHAECVLSQCASLTTGAGQARVIIRSVQSGAWNQPSTWNCACVPEALDKVVVMPGHNVTLPNNYTAHALELRQEGTLQNSANSVLRLNE